MKGIWWKPLLNKYVSAFIPEDGKPSQQVHLPVDKLDNCNEINVTKRLQNMLT